MPTRPLTVAQECDEQRRTFEYNLEPLRQYPGALAAWMYGHKPTDKLDYGMCYNDREWLKRKIAIDNWKKTTSPACQKHFRDEDARYSYRGKPETIAEEIARYNEACSHTMAGTL
ncbi:hypothetical protein [Microvirga terricola]|uniref:Uncharacterized protein n=1 Tax=Microvirga terricola TaxID=2719797 RepID=A0ABX0VCA1_9HYPH|nr:hypothetical protein [Microvirga terricola]NIX75462.1 hypothetical protein [Microvirga terricola]